VGYWSRCGAISTRCADGRGNRRPRGQRPSSTPPAPPGHLQSRTWHRAFDAPENVAALVRHASRVAKEPLA
jgi:hypothetical protein